MIVMPSSLKESPIQVQNDPPSFPLPWPNGATVMPMTPMAASSSTIMRDTVVRQMAQNQAGIQRNPAAPMIATNTMTMTLPAQHRWADCPDDAIAAANAAPGTKHQRSDDGPVAAALRDRAEAIAGQTAAGGVPNHVAQAVEQWRATAAGQSSQNGTLGQASPLWINAVEKLGEASDKFQKPKKSVRATRNGREDNCCLGSDEASTLR